MAGTPPLSLVELEQQRLCLGLPLLLPEPLVVVPVAVEPEQRAEEAEGSDLDQQVP